MKPVFVLDEFSVFEDNGVFTVIDTQLDASHEFETLEEAKEFIDAEIDLMVSRAIAAENLANRRISYWA